jgi:hypothetical protein
MSPKKCKWSEKNRPTMSFSFPTPIDLAARDDNRIRAFSMPPAARMKQRAETEYLLPPLLATVIDLASVL